ncbi:MAG: hypothetical protein PWP24_2015 [Clostridiales bacterium]|nr:hypothetical protein [Clostridiales bacterium]
MNEFSKKALKEQYKNRICVGGIYCIKCTESTKKWIRSAINLSGAKNRFDFSVSTNSCPEICMREDWNRYGASSFVFEIMEEITKKETQSDREFTEDVSILFEMWKER